jgi:hypothetical protein
MFAYIYAGGENCGRRTPQKIAEKLRKNCGKIAVFDIEKFRFPDSGQGKGAPKKIQVGTRPKPSRKYNLTHICGQFLQILIKNGC